MAQRDYTDLGGQVQYSARQASARRPRRTAVAGIRHGRARNSPGRAPQAAGAAATPRFPQATVARQHHVRTSGEHGGSPLDDAAGKRLHGEIVAHQQALEADLPRMTSSVTRLEMLAGASA
jgi:hypothetical protein